ncbi:MAG: GyrI-like domain-containing protein [Actinomycetota bacterium]|nr:GyrI-like domain-containing protein [Actinomycetota bacterium]
MDYQVELNEIAPQPVAEMRFVTSMQKIGEDIGIAFQKIFAYLCETGENPVGPPFTLYFYEGEFDPDNIDMEVCIPVSRVLEGKGEVIGREVPGGIMASTMHFGPYIGLEPAYKAIDAWVKDNGYRYSGPAREVYLNDPNQVDEKDLQTKILMQVSK